MSTLRRRVDGREDLFARVRHSGSAPPPAGRTEAAAAGSRGHCRNVRRLGGRMLRALLNKSDFLYLTYS